MAQILQHGTDFCNMMDKTLYGPILRTSAYFSHPVDLRDKKSAAAPAPLSPAKVASCLNQPDRKGHQWFRQNFLVAGDGGSGGGAAGFRVAFAILSKIPEVCFHVFLVVLLLTLSCM